MHKYLARFAVDRDSLFTATARLRLKSRYYQTFNARVSVLLMNDKEWDMALQSEDCGHRQSLARFQIPITLDETGEWSRWESAHINIINRAQVWYMLLAD